MEQSAERVVGQSFEELYVYRLARDFRISMTDLARRLPADERYNLSIQMRKAALSVTNNIAEGMGDTTTRKIFNSADNLEGPSPNSLTI